MYEELEALSTKVRKARIENQGKYSEADTLMKFFLEAWIIGDYQLLNETWRSGASSMKGTNLIAKMKELTA